VCTVLRTWLNGRQSGAMRSRSGKRIGLLLAVAVLAGPSIWPQNGVSKQEQIQAHMQRAQQAIRSSDFVSAEREFRAVVTLDPSNLDARGNVGVMRYFQGDWAGAAEQFRKVLEMQPKTWKVQAYLGMCEEHLGRPAEAHQLLVEALPHLERGPFETQAGLELAEILYQTGDLDGAVDVVRILLPSNTTNVDVLYTAARTYADLANRSRDALLLAAPDSARTHQLMAEMLINRGNSRAAMVQYRKALEVDPKLRGVHYELGEAILHDSRQADALQAAEKEFRVALAENPADGNAEYRLGTICSLRRDYRTAIEHYLRALQVQPDDAYANQALGVAWIRMGEPEKALEPLLKATHLDPLYSTAHYQLGMLYQRLGREADSRQELAAFKKLEESRKRIDQVYVQTRGEFPESDLTGTDAANDNR
jgi:tetratricopeptide (TPR) repeat protein